MDTRPNGGHRFEIFRQPPDWLKVTGVTPTWIVANAMVVARSLTQDKISAGTSSPAPDECRRSSHR